MVSAPATAMRNDDSSVTSPRTGSPPHWRTIDSWDSARTMPRTWWPAATSRSTRWLPMNPAAPVTNAFIAESCHLARSNNNHEDTRNQYVVKGAQSWLAAASPISPDISLRAGWGTMRIRLLALIGVLGAAWAIGGLAAWESLATPKPPPAADQGREAIEKSSRDFAAAFEKRDAKAIAGLWSESGE